MTIVTAGSRELRLAAFADELRADAANGLHYTDDPADVARFTSLRGLAAELYAHVDTRDTAAIAAIFDRQTGPRTPLVAVVLLFNDQRDGLLFVDGGDTVGTPYAFVAANSDHDSTVRSLAATLLPGEDTVPVPHGICDSVAAGLAMPHTYFLTYVVDVTLVDRDAVKARLVPEADTVAGRRDALTDYLMGGAARDVLEAPFALTDATADIVDQVRRIAVAGEAATASPYDVERFERIRQTCDALLEGVRNQAAFAPVTFAHLEARSATACADMLILDHERRILLIRRHDNHKWAMPGGACEVGETSAATATRESAEEVRLDIAVDGLAGIFDNSLIVGSPVRWQTCFVYVGHPAEIGAKPQTTPEAIEVEWFDLDSLDDLDDLWEHHRAKITGALKAIVE